METESTAGSLAERVEHAVALAETDREGGCTALQAAILAEAYETEDVKAKEEAIAKLCELYAAMGNADALQALLDTLKPFFAKIAKAKVAKIVRGVLESLSKIEGTVERQIALCQSVVEWAQQEKRTYLRQRVQSRLASLYLFKENYSQAITLINALLSEVKRLDDKLLLVEIHLLESKAHHALMNMPKAKAALTAARTAANAIYVPPASQGAIDMQSGILHAEEKDYKTAYSYFFEAFEQFSSLDDPRAMACLKYMLLSKIMGDQAEEVNGLINTKGGLKYVGPEVEAMKAVAAAYTTRSLHDFEAVLESHKESLAADRITESHFKSLYDTMMQHNLSRIIEPYTRVQIDYIAKEINLPQPLVEQKLSQMILDKKLNGTLDQGAGCLDIFEDAAADTVYPKALETVASMSLVVDRLHSKAEQLA